jgi:hypothetical protein
LLELWSGKSRRAEILQPSSRARLIVARSSHHLASYAFAEYPAEEIAPVADPARGVE